MRNALLALLTIATAIALAAAAAGQETTTTTEQIPISNAISNASSAPPNYRAMRVGVGRLRSHVNGVLRSKCRAAWPTGRLASIKRGLLPWTLGEWRRRHDRAHAGSSRCPNWPAAERSFHGAITLVGALFGTHVGTWVHDCNHSEGSDRMVWNGGTLDPGLRYYPGPAPGGESRAYGPMQFMESTFWRMFSGAVARLRARGPGYVPPRTYWRWNSNVAQALAGADGYLSKRTHEWQGATC